MKTTQEVIERLRQTSTNEQRVNILLEWGRECCEEQKRLCLLEVCDEKETEFEQIVKAIKENFKDAPLPEILKDK